MNFKSPLYLPPTRLILGMTNCILANDPSGWWRNGSELLCENQPFQHSQNALLDKHSKTFYKYCVIETFQ